jgi:hypothetical protein
MDVLNKKSYRKEDSMEVESIVIRTLKRSRSPEIFFPNKIQAVSANQILAHSPIFTSSSQIPATLRQSSFCSNVFKTNGLKYQRIPKAGHCLYRAVELYVGKSQEELHISEFIM